MSWTPDPELHQMFLDELTTRAGRMVEGADAVSSGDVGSIDLSTMKREGHTIKGTSRVMGYDAIGAAAEMLERVWRGMADGTVATSAEIGTALSAVASQLEAAGRSGNISGTANLSAAVAALGDLVPGVVASL